MKTRFEDCSSKIMFGIGWIACVFSAGRYNIPVLAWIWPACLLFSFRLFKSRREMFVAGILFLVSQTFRYWGYSGGGLGADALIGLLIGATILLPLLLDRIIYRRMRDNHVLLAILFAPFAFTAMIFLTDLVASVPQIAYSQGENLPLLQIASVIGNYGVSFLMIAFGSTAAYTLETKKFRPACICTGVLLAVVLLGGARLAFLPARGDRVVRMATALSPIEGDYLEGTLKAPDYDGNIAFLREKAEIAHATGAEVLCFAEEAFEYKDVEEERYLTEVSKIAKKLELNILFPADVVDSDGNKDGKRENKEFLFDRSGKIVATYQKTKLLPGPMEADEYQAGDGNILFAELPLSDGTSVSVSSVICFDSNNARYVTNMDDRTDVLLVPSWCWEGCSAYEAMVLGYRAVENNVSVVVPCMDAKSSTYDWTGNVIFRTESTTSGRDAITFTNVPIRNDSTRAPYHYISAWLDWVYVAGTVLMAAYVALGSKRKQGEKR